MCRIMKLDISMDEVDTDHVVSKERPKERPADRLSHCNPGQERKDSLETINYIRGSY